MIRKPLYTEQEYIGILEEEISDLKKVLKEIARTDIKWKRYINKMLKQITYYLE